MSSSTESSPQSTPAPEHLALALTLGSQVALVEGASHLRIVLRLADEREQHLSRWVPGEEAGQPPQISTRALDD